MAVTDIPPVTTEDIEIYRHGDKPMIVRLIRPDGAGPFPAILDLHGGCWCKGGPGECSVRGEVFAEAGMASAALDFRQAADVYPSSLEDINYALRWLKAHADELRLDATRIGILGQSSGGHLAMLAAMRPNEPRYGALPLETPAADVDASVRCVGVMWPVINPLSRYRRVVDLRAAGDPPAWVADLPERHDTYWVTEENMEEANPMLALERGEAVETPPALWIQGQPDAVHDYVDEDSGQTLTEPERFAANYRGAGGEIEVLYIDQDTRSSTAVFQALADFFVKNMG